MKKEVMLLAIFFLLIIPFAAAQNSSELTDQIKNASSIDVKAQTNKALATEVKIPENIKPIVKILFGIDENMPFSKFVVYLMVWLLIFLIIFQTVKMMPFFKKGLIQFIAALAISILAGNLGGIEAVVNLYYDLGIAKFIDTASPGAFFLAAVIIIVAYLVISRILSKISISLNKGEIDSSAVEAGTGYKMLRILSNTFGKKEKN